MLGEFYLNKKKFLRRGLNSIDIKFADPERFMVAFSSLYSVCSLSSKLRVWLIQRLSGPGKIDLWC